jgi:hypothetical protein
LVFEGGGDVTGCGFDYFEGYGAVCVVLGYWFECDVFFLWVFDWIFEMCG